MDELCEFAFGDECLQHLTRTRIDIERDAIVHLLSFYHRGDDRHVAVARIGGGADVGLVDLFSRDLPDRNDIGGTRRRRDQWFERRQVDLLVAVVGRAFVGGKRRPVALATFSTEEGEGRLVGREDARRGAELSAHVGDDVTVHRREAGEARTVIFDDPTKAAFNAVTTQHLEDDVLRADPVRERPGQPNAPNLRHAQV